MKKILLVLVVLLVLGGVGFIVMNSQKANVPAENAMPAPGASGVTETVVETQPPATGEAVMDKSTAKEFTLDSFEFGFDQKTLTVKKGDTVKITLTNSGKMPHDWVVDEFSAKTKQIKNGETDTVTFVADKAGTFEYYCGVGKHRANGMVGKLMVE